MGWIIFGVKWFKNVTVLDDLKILKDKIEKNNMPLKNDLIKNNKVDDIDAIIQNENKGNSYYTLN